MSSARNREGGLGGFRLIPILALSIVGCGPAAPQAAHDSHLKLVEAQRFPLPQSLSVSGASVDEDDRIVVWSKDEAYLSSQQSNAKRLNLNGVSGRVVASEFVDDGQLQVMVSTPDGATLVAFDAEGRHQSRREISLPISVVGASRVDGVWYVAGVSKSVYQVLRVALDGTTASVVQIQPGLGGRDSGAVSAHLSRRDHDLVVSLTRSPFTVWIVRTQTDSVSALLPRTDPRIESAMSGSHRAAWVALKGVPIDSGTVHTLADLGSDARIFFVVSRSGRLLTVRKLAAPIGFVDSSLPRRRLCAVRALSVREIVCYDWKWEPAGGEGFPVDSVHGVKSTRVSRD